MMKKAFRTLLCVALFLIATIPQTYGQTESKGIQFKYEYQSILLDSTYNSVDLTVQNYIEQLRERMNKELSVVIGEADQEMRSFKPQSPLSNFLTDILFDFGNQFLAKTHSGTRANLSVLNFGGIRSSLLAGPITIEDIYKVAPFDNKVVIIDIRGTTHKVFQQIYGKGSCCLFASPNHLSQWENDAGNSSRRENSKRKGI